jgi:hypothetical protein
MKFYAVLAACVALLCSTAVSQTPAVAYSHQELVLLAKQMREELGQRAATSWSFTCGVTRFGSARLHSNSAHGTLSSMPRVGPIATPHSRPWTCCASLQLVAQETP